MINIRGGKFRHRMVKSPRKSELYSSRTDRQPVIPYFWPTRPSCTLRSHVNTKSLWTRWTRSRIPAHSFFQSLERLGERHRTIQTLKYLESISFVSGKLYSRNAVENYRNEFVVLLVQHAKFLEFEIAIIRSLKRRILCQPGTLEGVTASAGVGATLSAPFRRNCQVLRYTSVPVTTTSQKFSNGLDK